MSETHIRLLTSADQLDYLRVLGQLSPTTEVTSQNFEAFCEDTSKETWVLCQNSDNTVLAIGSLYKLVKMSRSGTILGVIEDIVVDQAFRGQNYGRQMVEHLVERARSNGCYKCILSAKAENAGFYQKIGFQSKEVSMMLYF